MGWWSDFWSGLLVSGATVVQESALPSLDYTDPDIELPGNQNAQNWRRLTQSPTDLSPLTQDRMQELALWLSDRNPLAKGIVDLLTAFIVGEGFTASSKDENVQRAISRFWDDAQNDMASRVEDFTRELSIYGEQLVLAFVNESSGRVALVSVDPKTIKGVVRHPLATDRAYAVALASDSNEPRYVKIIAEDDDPSSPTFGKLIGAQPGEGVRIDERSVQFYQPPSMQPGMVLSGCFFFPINKPRAAMRGRSDLLPVSDFVDLYDRLIFDEAERMSFLRAFVWDVKITGATADDLATRARTEGPPKPGSLKLHNESEEWTAVSPELNSADSQNTADLILSLVATGVGLPKVWLNGIMDANRATASEMGEPALKRLVARQKYVRRCVERMVRFALDQAEIAGALESAGDERHQFAVSTPEMSAKDLEKAARSLMVSTQAMGMATAAGWMDAETAQDVVAMMLGQLGIDVDLADLRERLAAAEGERDDYEIPAYFGMGKSAGPDSLRKALNPGDQGGDGEGDALPPMDATTATDIISKLSKSLVELGNARVIDGQFAQEVVAALFAKLGIEVDPEEMQSRLEAEKEAAAATEQPPAPPAEGDGLPGMLDLDAEAMAEVLVLGEGDLRRGLTLFAEAFEASLHPRGEGGRFAPKPKTEEQQGGGVASGASNPKARELARKVGERKPRTPRAPNAPKRTRSAPKNPAMKSADLRDEISGLKPGKAVEIELTNGLTVRGTVEVAQGGVAVLKTADGQYAVLHDRLKGVARVKTPASASSAA